MSPEERLAQRAAHGDQRAFEEIYDRYHQDLYRFCLAMVGSPQDAQDALQNTMVKVLRSLPGEQREIRLKPWLYRIARNESVEILRRRRDTVELEPQQTTGVAVAATAEARERLRTLLADLEQLPERQRAALVMRELSGLDFDQIGAAFGTSAAVARQTLYEARLSLRHLEAGREMRCAEVMRELSNADGRIARRREIRAHLRSCAVCRAFRDDIARRHQDLTALAPLPAAVSASLLHGVLEANANALASAAAAGTTAAGSGLAGAIGAGAGKGIATSALVKSVATVAAAAVVGVSAADRSHLIDLPLPGRGGDPPARSGPPGSSVPASSGAGSAAEHSTQPQDGSTSQPDRSEAGDRGEESKGGSGGPGKAGAGHASSRSEAGQDPVGGGHGRSAAERKGQPESLPDAASGGQQTAAARKPAQAGSPPDRAGAPSRGKSALPDAPPSKPAPQPKAKAPAANPSPPEPSTEAPSPAAAGPTTGAAGGAPPGLER